MNKVMDVDTAVADADFNSFVARRICRLFILMANANIALKTESTPGHLTKACYDLLAKQNYIVSYTADASTTSAFGLTQALGYVVEKKAGLYKKNYDTIQDINQKLLDNKDTLKASQIKLADQTKGHQRLRLFEYLAIAIFIIIGGIAATLIIVPLKKKTRFAGCGGLILLSVANAFLLNFFFKKQASTRYEDFTTLTYSYQVGILREAIVYLGNTPELSNLLHTYRVLDNTNLSMNKEISYYSDSNEQLINANLKVDDLYNVSYREDIQYSALMNLLISLSLVIAGTTTAYIATEELQDGQKVSVGIGGGLSVIAITIFLIEVNRRVHTDPRKIYWGQPDANKFS
jgi:hypothetical protein